MQPVLEGKVAIVTGSSSGIGEAIARMFAAEGASVVVNSARSVAQGEAIAAELPNDAIYVRADVAQEDQAKALIQATLDRFGRLDVLVNNAGTTRVIPHHALDAVTDDDWQRILGTNVLGTWYVTRGGAGAQGPPRLDPQHHVGGGRARRRQLDPLRGVEGRAQSPDRCSPRARPRDPRQRGGARVDRHAVDRGLGRHPSLGARARAASARHARRHRARRVLLTVSSYSTGEFLLADGGINLR